MRIKGINRSGVSTAVCGTYEKFNKLLAVIVLTIFLMIITTIIIPCIPMCLYPN